jgi:hypothetical protein
MNNRLFVKFLLKNKKDRQYIIYPFNKKIKKLGLGVGPSFAHAVSPHNKNNNNNNKLLIKIQLNSVFYN